MKIRAPHSHSYIRTNVYMHAQAFISRALRQRRLAAHTNICGRLKWTFAECITARAVLFFHCCCCCSCYCILPALFIKFVFHAVVCCIFFPVHHFYFLFYLSRAVQCSTNTFTHLVTHTHSRLHSLCRYLSLHSLAERGSQSGWTRRASNIHFIRAVPLRRVFQQSSNRIRLQSNIHALHSSPFKRPNDEYNSKDNNKNYDDNDNDNARNKTLVVSQD